MKKTLSILLTLLLLLSLSTAALASSGTTTAELAYRGITIEVNGMTLVPQDETGKGVEPFIIDGTTYLPVRAVAGALGLDVDWDGATSTVILTSGAQMRLGEGTPVATSGTKTAELAYRDIQIVLDGVTLEPKDVTGRAVEPFIIDGTTYLPVRAVGEALGAEVGWDGATSTVTLLCVNPPEGVSYLLSRASVSISAGSFGSTSSSVVNSYDEKGRLTQTSSRARGETTLVSYSYDEKGQLVKTEESVDGALTASTAYRYNSDGTLGAATTTESESGAVTRVVYSYFADGKVKDATYYSVEDGESKLTGTKVYDYDNAGNLSRESYTGSEAGSYTLDYTYDGDGNVLTMDYRSRDMDALYLPSALPGVENAQAVTGALDSMQGIFSLMGFDSYSVVNSYTNGLLLRSQMQLGTVYVNSRSGYDLQGNLVRMEESASYWGVGVSALVTLEYAAFTE